MRHIHHSAQPSIIFRAHLYADQGGMILHAMHMRAYSQSSASAGCLINRSRNVLLRASLSSSYRSGSNLSSVRGFHAGPRKSQTAYSKYMNVRQRSCTSIDRKLALISRQFQTTSHAEPMEEETVPRYKAGNFLPLRLGQVVHDRYLIVSKLGFGTSSTIWLVQDHK